MFKGKYTNSISHDIMVNDTYRMDLYYQAIKNKVVPGDTVVDFGAGSGVLSLMAAKCGAKKVYAIEEDTTVAKQLEHNIKLNDMQDVIEIYLGSSESFIKEKRNLKIDLIVSECIGDHLFESRMLYDFLDFIDKFNVPKQIPEKFELFVYGEYIRPKNKKVKLPIKLDISKKILPNELLDTCYFVDGHDISEYYYKFIKSDQDHKLFQFKSINDINICDGGYIKSCVKFKSNPTINDNAMMYFKVKLDHNNIMTNHPNRPNTGSHSYYQRIINLQNVQSKHIEFKINVLKNTSGLEDVPFPNLFVGECNG